MTWKKLLSQFVLLFLFFLPLFGCGVKDTEIEETICLSDELPELSQSDGEGYVFITDPISSSGEVSLSPTSLQLNDYSQRVKLENLTGKGILQGEHVEVLNGISCDENFNAYNIENLFLYSHDEEGFQETMSYYYSDQYLSYLNKIDNYENEGSFRVVAHCMNDDNAFFYRSQDALGNVIQKVCLGDSVVTPGASYADDASVIIHELQHASTTSLYSQIYELNQFWTDEAGALNEAVSDFFSLMYLHSEVDPLDPKVFSRWALGTFIPNYRGNRGAHLCPEYDERFPICDLYETSASGFSADENKVSYSYPDGLGWPFANNFSAPGYLRSVYLNYQSQEEIHNNATVLVGALWDVYEAILENKQDLTQARDQTGELVLESLKHLPQPTEVNVSPVNFIEFSNALIEWAVELNWSEQDQTSLEQALANRGLYSYSSVEDGWAAVGEGEDDNLGLKIIDNGIKLKAWLYTIGSDPDIINQSLGDGNTNSKMSPGEVVVVWFDVKNQSEQTVGSTYFDVTSMHPSVTFLDLSANLGAISDSKVQMQYYKINGTGIVDVLSSENETMNVPTGSSYFQTNPFFGEDPSTAIWVKIDDSIESGEVVDFQLDIYPSNGEAQTLIVSSEIE